MLMAAAGVSLALGEYGDFVIIRVVIVIYFKSRFQAAEDNSGIPFNMETIS